MSESLPTDVIAKLEDLLKQATTERSHYYVASCCREAIAEIKRLRDLAEFGGPVERKPCGCVVKETQNSKTSWLCEGHSRG